MFCSGHHNTPQEVPGSQSAGRTSEIQGGECNHICISICIIVIIIIILYLALSSVFVCLLLSLFFIIILFGMFWVYTVIHFE